MTLLASLAETVNRFIAAACVDTRTGTIVAHHAVRDEPFVMAALEVAIEVMRSPQRPPRVVLLSRDHAHIIQRLPHDPHRVLAVLCERSGNLGLAVALVRSRIAEATC